jgi:hypothetical protein
MFSFHSTRFVLKNQSKNAKITVLKAGHGLAKILPHSHSFIGYSTEASSFLRTLGSSIGKNPRQEH